MAEGEARGALDGIRVIDLTTVVLGPWAAQMMGDMGADVVKVETPEGDMTRNAGPRRNEGMASFFMGTNRNKRSVVLDLRTAKGQEALDRLVAGADVLLHNFRPKVAAKLGITHERFAKGNPGLIYCATYGFRADGPMADNAAYDDIIQAASGVADLQMVASDQPRYVPTIMADKTSSLALLAAVLAAVVHRERGGGGQAIEVPMFETLVDFLMVEHLSGAGFEPPEGKMGYQRLLNTMRKPYATTDGYLAVLPYTDANWRDFFAIADRADLAADPRFKDHATRIAHSEEVYGLLAKIVATRSTADWERALAKAGIPVQAVLSKEDLLTNEQLLATGFWRFADHPTEGRIRMTDPPARFSASPSAIRRLQPRLGEHSAEILAEAGYSEGEIADMFAAGVSKPAA